MRGRGIRVIVVLTAALGFGVAAAVLKGNGSGVRDGIGNLSAPWVVVPLLASAAVSRGRIGVGVAVGTLATLGALLGFYLANAFVLDLGPHSTLHDVSLTVNSGNLWIRAGLVSGPIVGAAGAWAVRRGRFAVAAIAIGTVALEPLAVLLAYGVSNGMFAAGNGQWNDIYAGEGIAGTIAAVALWRLHVARRGARAI